jgi:hypothetical protein
METMSMKDWIEQRAGFQATGRLGAGEYRKWAREQGYLHLEVMNDSSPEGDWCFIVSKDGTTWHIMVQTSKHPDIGFERSVNRKKAYSGTSDQVLDQLSEEYGREDE